MKAGLITTFITILFNISSYSVQSLNLFSEQANLFASENKTDTSLAKTFFHKGNDLLKELKYDSAIVFFGKAKMIYEKENLWENYFNCVNLISTALRSKEEVDSSI